MTCAPLNNGQSSAPAVPLFQQDSVIASFDLTAQGNIDLVAVPGVHNLQSEEGPTVPFTAIGQTVDSGYTFEFGATGLRFAADVNSTVFTSTVATRTAANLQMNLLDFWNAFGVDGMRNYFFSIYCTVLTLPTAQVSPTGFHFGMLGLVNVPGASSARYRAIRRHNAAGAQALGTIADGAANGNYTSPLPDAFAPSLTTCFGFQLGDGAMDCYAGDYDPAAEDWDDVLFTRQVASLITTTTGGAQYKDRGNNLVIAYPTGNVNANMVVVSERLVIASPR